MKVRALKWLAMLCAFNYILLVFGWCYSKFHFVSSKELIVAALRYESGANQFPLRYATPEEALAFFDRNTDCCSVDWLSGWSFLRALYGRRDVVVKIVVERDNKNGQGRYRSSETLVTTCGNVLQSVSEYTDRRRM
jgi:hypothetical protein